MDRPWGGGILRSRPGSHVESCSPAKTGGGGKCCQVNQAIDRQGAWTAYALNHLRHHSVPRLAGLLLIESSCICRENRASVAAIGCLAAGDEPVGQRADMALALSDFEGLAGQLPGAAGEPGVVSTLSHALGSVTRVNQGQRSIGAGAALQVDLPAENGMDGKAGRVCDLGVQMRAPSTPVESCEPPLFESDASEMGSEQTGRRLGR